VFAPTTITREVVELAVRERMDRMKTQHVDLLQVSVRWLNGLGVR
jgi:aryl-alcohol dehydrogenase-like predicted oxidoreductase